MFTVNVRSNAVDGEYPRQEIADSVDWMIGDAGEHCSQIAFRIDAVDLRTLLAT